MTDPARIQRIAAAVRACAESWVPEARLLGNVTAAEIRELAIAASHAVAPPEPVAVEWLGNDDYSTADAGPLELTSWRKVGSATWDWDVENGHTLIGKGQSPSAAEAKAAAIAAARAWRDSIRL